MAKTAVTAIVRLFLKYGPVLAAAVGEMAHKIEATEDWATLREHIRWTATAVERD